MPNYGLKAAFNVQLCHFICIILRIKYSTTPPPHHIIRPIPGKSKLFHNTNIIQAEQKNSSIYFMLSHFVHDKYCTARDLMKT